MRSEPSQKTATFTEQLEGSHPTFIKQRPRSVGGIRQTQAMLIPSAKVVDAYIGEVPRGTTVDVATLRSDLAKRHGAEATCPVTVRRHLRVVAEAALEKLKRGGRMGEVTPFWRLIDPATSAAKVLSCGADFIRRKRAEERSR